jgi:hypothetical protein
MFATNLQHWASYLQPQGKRAAFFLSQNPIEPVDADVCAKNTVSARTPRKVEAISSFSSSGFQVPRPWRA